MFRYFYFITFGQEGVEPVNQLAVALEERRNSSYNTGRVDLLALEGLHDLEKLIVDLGLVPELGLDLVEVEERVLDLCVFRVLMPPGGPGGRSGAYISGAVQRRPRRGPCGALSRCGGAVSKPDRREGASFGRKIGVGPLVYVYPWRGPARAAARSVCGGLQGNISAFQLRAHTFNSRIPCGRAAIAAFWGCQRSFLVDYARLKNWLCVPNCVYSRSCGPCEISARGERELPR